MSFFNDLKKKYTELLNPVKKSLSDDSGWFRQGQFTPGKQVQDIRQQQSQSPITMAGPLVIPNFRNQQVQEQFKPLVQPFKNFANQGILAGQTALSVPLQAMGVNYGPSQKLIKKVQDVGMLSKEGKIGGNELRKSGINTANVILKTAGLANPALMAKSAITGGILNSGVNTYQNIKQKQPLINNLGQSFQQGMVSGMANAGTTRLTSGLVGYLSKSIPALKPLTDEALSKAGPVATDTLKKAIGKWLSVSGKKLFKGAVIETLVETPIWATLTQGDQEKFKDAILREAEENLKMNIAFAGLDATLDTRTLAPIVKQSIDQSVNNYFKKVSTPEGLKAQAGSVQLPIKTGGDIVNKNQISEMGRLKTAEIDNVWKKIPDGTTSKDGYIVKRGDKLYPTEKATPKLLKNSLINLNPDGSIKEGFVLDRMSFTEDIALDSLKSKSVEPIKTGGEVKLQTPEVKGVGGVDLKKAIKADPYTYLKAKIPEIKDVQFDGGMAKIKTKDGNEIRLGMSVFSDGLTISNIEADIKGTGIGTKIVRGLQEWTNSRYGTIGINKAYNHGFWEKTGFTGADEYSKGWSSGDKMADLPPSTPEVKPIKTTSVNQPASLKTTQQPQNLSPNKTSPLVPEKPVLVKTSEYPSPNINTNRLNVTTKSKNFVDKTVEEVKPQIETVVGKKLSNKEAIDFADNSAKVLNKAITRQETLEWEAKMLKARQLLAKQATDGKVTQEYIDNLIAVKSQGTDIARKLQSLSVGADAKEVTAKQAILEAVMKVTKDTDAILKKAKGVDFNDYEQAASFYREFVKPNLNDWLDKLRFSSMLSSPNTHINNFSSNYQGTGIIAPLEKTIAGGVDKLASALRPGRSRQQYSGEGLAYAKGYYSNVSKAWKNFTDTLGGKKLSSAQEMYSLPLSAKGTGSRKIENILEFPGKLLQAADEFFQTLTSGGVESSLKYRQSKGTKVSGIEDKAYLESRKRLFNSEFNLKGEGPILKALEFIPQKVSEARASSNPVISTVAKYTFPFVRVPSNIFKASIEYGPLGVGTIPGASNKVGQLAKSILGTSIGLTTATLVAGDNMTWAEPTDEKKRNAFRAAGMQPYSIRVGDKWYSYSKMHPAIAFNLAMVAAIRDAEKNKTLDDGQVDTLLNGVARWVNFYADMSYVKNLGDAVSGAKGDISAGTRQISNYVQQLVPFRALMGWVARLVDPYQRQVDTDGTVLQKQLQQLQTQIPLLSQSVPARLDSKGNPIENQNRVINAFSPVRVTNVVPQAESTYKGMVTKTINTRNENIVKDRVSSTGQEEIYNGKKYYPSFETDSKTGEKVPVVKSVKVPQTTSEIYSNLSKDYESSPDSPQNILQKVMVYGEGIFKDPKGTLEAIKSGQPIRKVRGDAVVVERLKNLSSLDQGDKATEVDHVIAVALGGSNNESNLQVISKQDNRAKGVVDTYLAKELEAGRITKKEAQERDLNWRQEINTLPASEKAKAQKILSENPIKITTTTTNTLESLASREYEPIKTDSGYSNIQLKLPEPPKLTGQTELDKQLKSKYSSALSTYKTNIGKLYLDGQLTAEEANKALTEISNKKISVSKSKKPKKVTFKKPKVIKLKAVKIKYAKIKMPKIKKVKAYKRPRIKKMAVKRVKLKLPKA